MSTPAPAPAYAPAPVLAPVRPAWRRMNRLDGLVLTAIAVAVWAWLGWWTQGVAITPPLATFAYLGQLVLTPMFWDHVQATLAAFALAFVLSAVFGLATGLLLGLRRFAGDVLEPVLAGFYTIPKVTLYPVVLLLFGLGTSAKVAFGIMHGLVPVAMFTLGAVKTLPPVLLRAARAMRLDGVQTMRTVLVPACLPQIVNGMRIGFSLSLLGVLIGEMFSSQRGLGFLLVNGLAQHNVPLTTAVVFLIVAFAITANTLALRLSARIPTR